MFIVLLSLSESLATKCLSLGDEPCIVRHTLIDLNPVELKCYLLIISIDNCTGSCNVLSPEIRVPKDISVKAFNLITNKNETKKMGKHASCDCKCKFSGATCNSN